jgi:hypothetical protein
MHLALYLLSFLLFAGHPAQENKVLGEVRFDGDTKTDLDAGIWVDGKYLGYVKELKKDPDKKVLLIPGEHKIVAKESGYTDWSSDVDVQPGKTETVLIKLVPAPGAHEPETTGQLKITVQPSRAAVFVDNQYDGHAGETGGAVHSLLLPPGHHHIRVSLPGYHTFETDVDLVAGQKSEIKTELLKEPAQ